MPRLLSSFLMLLISLLAGISPLSAMFRPPSAVGPNDYNYVRHNPRFAWDPNGLATSFIPNGTNDIGYVTFSGDPSAPSITTNPGVPDLSDLLPDYDVIAAIVEANSTPPAPSDFHYPIELIARDLSIRQMDALADSGNLSPSDTRKLRVLSQDASNAEFNSKIFTSTLDGLGWIVSFIEPTPFGEEIMTARTAGRLMEGGVGGAKGAAGKSLLFGEGAVGTYDDLITAGFKGDNITPHHIPSANHMAQRGVSKGDGIAINMEHPFPGSGGRHRATFTYGTQTDLNLTPRQALGRGIWDARSIYRHDGLYNLGIRSSLQDVIRQNRAANPGLFN